MPSASPRAAFKCSVCSRSSPAQSLRLDPQLFAKTNGGQDGYYGIQNFRTTLPKGCPLYRPAPPPPRSSPSGREPPRHH